MVTLTWGISIGDILMFCSMIIGGIGFAIRVGASVTRMEEKLKDVEQDMAEHTNHAEREMAEMKVDIKSISSVLITIARQDERLIFLERRMNEMGAALAANHNARMNNLSKGT